MLKRKTEMKPENCYMLQKVTRTPTELKLSNNKAQYMYVTLTFLVSS